MSEKFADMVKRAFSFLESAGFRITKSDLGQALYESDRASVAVTWDSRSGELDAFVGMLPMTGQAQDQYSIADVMGAAGVPASECKLDQVGDESRLAPFVERLATNLRTHAQPALVGDRMYFRRLETFRGAKAETYMREMNLRQVRSQAERAWQDRQYDKVVSLYSSVEGDLTESESRKLDYARQHRAG